MVTSDNGYDTAVNITKRARKSRVNGTGKLSERLTEFRLNKDLTYQQFAALTRVSKSVLHRIEHDPNIKLHARTIRKLERFLEAARAA